MDTTNKLDVNETMYFALKYAEIEMRYDGWPEHFSKKFAYEEVVKAIKRYDEHEVSTRRKL